MAFEKGDTLYIPLHDVLGNVCLVLDASGKPLETLRYTASKRLDQESGFYYFGRRHYDPNVGRWMTPDPLGFEDGLNLYSYVHNSPLTHIDPDGQFAFLIPIAVGFLISHAIDYVLPVAVSYVGQCAGGTAAALVSGGLNGYNMNYSQGLFANDPVLGSTEKFGMALGTLISLNPANLVKKGGAIASVATRELYHYGSNLASKRIGKACSLTENTARKLASETAATCAKTVEKTTEKVAEKALEKTAKKVTTVAEEGLARVAKEGDWAKLTDMLQQSAKGKGNFTIGSATREQANAMGKAWVGNGYKISSNGKAWTSVNGLRQYRPPSFKPRLDKNQANFERKFEGQLWSNWPSNAHLNIID